MKCLFKKLGRSYGEDIHCGNGAYAYTQHNRCLEKLGFVDKFREDPRACDRPGVVRVYFGNLTKPPGTTGFRRKNAINCKKFDSGSYCGHIEFKRVNDKWYAACEANQARNVTAPGTRILKACYVLPKTDEETLEYE